MSKWTEIRDNVVDALDPDIVTEEIKQNLLQGIVENVLPEIEEVVTQFTDTLQEQAKDESGWCKVRDSVVLPYTLSISLAVIKLIGKKTLEKITAN